MSARKQLIKTKCWLLLLSLASLSVGAPAQEPAEPIDRFEVELVVFSYRDVLGDGEELLRQPEPDEPFGPLGEMDPSTDPNQPEPEPEDPGEPPVIQVTRLLNEQLQMTDIRQRINRVDAYQLLLHAGFAQEGVAEIWADPVSVRRLRAPAQLDGTVSLHRGRFLHVNLELTLNPGTGFGEPYRLNQQRRLRSGEIHYFDHPAIGVVLTVRPEQEPETLEPESVDNTADLAPGAAP